MSEKRQIVVLLRRLMQAPTTVDGDEVLGRCERAALAAALTLRVELEGEVTALSVGTANHEDRVLAIALRAGCDRAVRISDPAAEGLDYLGVAQILAAAVKKLSFDLIVCGDRSQDERQGATGPALAGLLSIPHLTGLVDLRGTDGSLNCLRRANGQLHELSCTLPAVMCVASFSMARQPPDSEYAGPRGGAIDALTLADLDLEGRDLAYRRRFVGSPRARRPGTNASVVKSPVELVRRLTADRVIE